MGRKHLLQSIQMLCAIVFTMAATKLFAEGGTCPEGYYPVNSPGVMGCAPIPGSGLPQEQVIEWEDRWISVAFGKNGFGAAVDMPSKRKAEKLAIANCKQMGGLDCHINLTTYNQCIAVAGGGHTAPTAGASNKKIAESIVMKDCADDRLNSSCEIYFSACSYPVQVR